jgi:hypothetical protein
LLGLDQPRKVTLSGKLEQADNSAAAILAARLDAIEERAKSAVAG